MEKRSKMANNCRICGKPIISIEDHRECAESFVEIHGEEVLDGFEDEKKIRTEECSHSYWSHEDTRLKGSDVVYIKARCDDCGNIFTLKGSLSYLKEGFEEG